MTVLLSMLLMSFVLVACGNADSASEVAAKSPEEDTDLILVEAEDDSEMEEMDSELEEEIVEPEAVVLVGYIASREDNKLVVENISGDFELADDVLIVYYDDAHLFEAGDKVEVRTVGMTMSIPAQAVSPTVTRVEE